MGFNPDAVILRYNFVYAEFWKTYEFWQAERIESFPYVIIRAIKRNENEFRWYLMIPLFHEYVPKAIEINDPIVYLTSSEPCLRELALKVREQVPDLIKENYELPNKSSSL